MSDHTGTELCGSWMLWRVYVAAGVWLHVAAGGWLHVIAGVWLHVAAGVWLHVATGIWLHVAAGVWLHVAAGIWLHVAAGIWLYVAAGIWLHVLSEGTKIAICLPAENGTRNFWNSTYSTLAVWYHTIVPKRRSFISLFSWFYHKRCVCVCVRARARSAKCLLNQQQTLRSSSCF